MRKFFSLRRITTVAALALLGLSWVLPDARAEDTKFQARASFKVVSIKGAHSFIVCEGKASPGGQFTSTVETHVNFGNYHETGVQTLDFGKGDTLSISFEDDWVPNLDPAYPAGGYRVGPYVVTGGTGRLAGASGSGILTGIPNGDGTGTVYLDGTLSW